MGRYSKNLKDKFLFRQPVVAVDFDGTVVDNEFPNVGKPKKGALKALKNIVDAGWRIILWTCRDGEFLIPAIKFFEEHDIPLAAVNENVPELDFKDKVSVKVVADVYIDDLAYGWDDNWEKVELYLLKLYDKRKAV